MIILVDIIANTNPSLGSSYGNFEFVKYGLMCWIYQDPAQTLAVPYSGETEWINQAHFITESKLPQPIGYKIWFQPGVIANVTPRLETSQQSPDVEVNEIITNLNTGLGIAQLFEALP